MLAINFSPFPALSTEQLHFRQLSAEDVNEIFKLRSDERVNRFLSRNQCKTFEEAAALINKINRGISNNEWIYWGVTLKGDNKLVGTICLWNIQPENYRAEIGYELYPDFFFFFFMREAMARTIEYAFETMKLHTLEADTDPGNSQSVLLLEKNGFVKEGHFKESVYFEGKFTDRAVYSLISRSGNATG